MEDLISSQNQNTSEQTSTGTPQLSGMALELFHRAWRRVQSWPAAERLWELHFSAQDRRRLGGDLRTALNPAGPIGMWMKLRGVTPQRAALDLGKLLNFLTQAEFITLRSKIGESIDTEQCLAETVAAGNLVLQESPRQAHWCREQILVDWDRFPALWEFLWELARQAKQENSLDVTHLSEHSQTDLVTRRKSRLKGKAGFPQDLMALIKPAGRGTQRLQLAPQQIHLFIQADSMAMEELLP